MVGRPGCRIGDGADYHQRRQGSHKGRRLSRLPLATIVNTAKSESLSFDRQSEDELGLQLADVVAGHVRDFFRNTPHALTEGTTARLITATSDEPLQRFQDLDGLRFKVASLRPMSAPAPAGKNARRHCRRAPVSARRFLPSPCPANKLVANWDENHIPSASCQGSFFPKRLWSSTERPLRITSEPSLLSNQLKLRLGGAFDLRNHRHPCPASQTSTRPNATIQL